MRKRTVSVFFLLGLLIGFAVCPGFAGAGFKWWVRASSVLDANAATANPTDARDYDVAPDGPDGVVDPLDLIDWLTRVDRGDLASPILFDFARFWNAPVREFSPAARYEVEFDATWRAATHPTDFPSGAHFSGLIGGTHNANAVFWAPGGFASPGIESMAETGAKTLLQVEVEGAVAEAKAESVLSGGGVGSLPGSVTVGFAVSRDFPRVTLVTMIAPSPDWFVGVSGLNLFEGGAWRESVVVPLWPFDAGTDSGATYTSPNRDTSPQEPIAEIEGAPFVVGQTVPPLGKFTFRRLD